MVEKELSTDEAQVEATEPLTEPPADSAPLDAPETATDVDAELIEAVTEEAALDSLKQQLAEAQAKVQEHWDTVLRQKAEQENLRKRMARDVENARKYALERFAGELLPVKDSLEMGLEAADRHEVTVETLREGSELILKMLGAAMEKFEISEINPVGEKFDPHLHEAMAMAPDPNVEPNTVVMVHQKGYQLHDRLLRPARVIVAKAVEAG